MFILLHSLFQAQGLRRCVEEIVFSFTYPRLDMEVWAISILVCQFFHSIPFKTSFTFSKSATMLGSPSYGDSGL
jgi:hypothetical protein